MFSRPLRGALLWGGDMCHDYLGLSNDRFSYGLLVGLFCLIFSLPAFSAIQWEPDPANPNGQILVRRSSNGTLLQILDSTPGDNFQWSFPANGSGGVIPTSAAPAIDVPFNANGASGVIPVDGISEASAIDAADLAASAAPDILSLAGKALPLVGPALTLWDLYQTIEGSSGSSYSSDTSSDPPSPLGCNSDGSYVVLLVDGGSSACNVYSVFAGPYPTQTGNAFVASHNTQSALANCTNYEDRVYSQGTGPDGSYCSPSGQYSGPPLSSSAPSLQNWTASQTASTIANDIAKYLGSNPSFASQLANDLASQPGGTPLSSPTPINYSGPSSASGPAQTVTTTNPDGSTSTQTVSPTVNITYGPDVSISNDTTTKNYYCDQGVNPSTASTGSVAAPVSSTNSTGTCTVTASTQSGALPDTAAVAPTESFPAAPTVSVVANTLSFNPTLTSNGQCPPDVTFSLFGASYNISWQPICGFAGDIYPFVTASGAILSAVLIFR